MQFSRLIVTVCLLMTISVASLSASVLKVRPHGVFSNLKTAISHAQVGDTIRLYAGHYREHEVQIDKPLTIEGIGRPTLEADGKGTIINVVSPGVSIRGIRFTGARVSFVKENAAILLNGVHECNVVDNYFDDNFFAIYASKSSHCTILGNEINGNAQSLTSAGNGIHLWYCNNFAIENNSVKRHRDGIYFEFVTNTSIVGNLSAQNFRYGLHFMFSDSCLYERNEFFQNGAGVAVMYTRHVEMVNNVFRDSWGGAAYGLLLKDIKNSRIFENKFIGNSIGIHIEGSNQIQIERNQLIDNGWAIRIMANCLDNDITNNDFVDNSFQVATNSRQSNSIFSGNYWSTYQGYDLDRDGYGDVPYRPVTLYSLLVESNPPTLVLLRSLLIDALNLAERIIPTLTPETLVDSKPRMRPNV